MRERERAGGLRCNIVCNYACARLAAGRSPRRLRRCLREAPSPFGAVS